MKHQLAIGLSSAAFVCAPAFAEDPKPLSTDVEVGYIATSGNTETSSFKGRVEIKQELNRFRNAFKAEGLYKRDQIEVETDGVVEEEERTTAEKYFLSARSDLKLNDEYMGLFGFGSYEEDKFSGFVYQSTLAVGFSDRLLNFSAGHLDYSIGPGIGFNETEDSFDADDNLLPGESSSTPVLRLTADFLYNLSENSAFTQSFASDVGVQDGENTKSKSETALSANIIGSLAMKASYIVDHNTHVLEGKKHADTQTAVTLVYSF
ncbi:DUF481 domain-containing protein [Agaribacterium haliotis]|uniref:DUF481 domain-containing protein n=1 Tax=Agaribacterium haliotis TaxID=2013869 RepID=UPI000BB564B9|nr:DUF481 domain-containing protein [Agaribacterium haliotis]